MFWARRRRKARLKAGSHLLEITEDALVKSRLESALVCAKGGYCKRWAACTCIKGSTKDKQRVQVTQCWGCGRTCTAALHS
jgi:hypothetical protein